MSKRIKHLTGILFTLLLSAHSFGQIDLEQVMTGYFTPEVIRENKIKSVMLYVDINENDIHKRGSYSGKTQEVQFNENGLSTYEITNHNNGYVPFLEYGNGSFIILNAYNDDDLLTNKYTENFRGTIEEQHTYDASGNKITTTYIAGGETVLKIGFEWEKGNMIKANTLFANETNKNRVNQYDEKGRILSSKSGTYAVKYQYTQNKDTLYTTIKTFRADSLFTTEKMKTLFPQNVVIGYLKTDHANQLMTDMKAQIDQFGNATNYYINDLTNTYHGDETYPPTRYEIQNEYNAQNLLIKRLFYYSRGDVAERWLTKIEKYFYDTTPLPYTLEKGSVFDEIEVEAEEMMDR